MKQIVVISGKGGTGKTVITASFAVLAKNKVMVDCDVDAADLHLLLKPRIIEQHEFKGLPKASIDHTRCNGCGECVSLCRYGAIIQTGSDNSSVEIDPIACEGCGVCKYACPVEAICMVDNVAGEWYVSETAYGPMVHARLGIAAENSGKLVTTVRQHARSIAERDGAAYVIIDGPPGIGCPVIASLSGVDLALIVTEPTLSGIHDMKRVIGVAKHFGVPAACVVNKYDINPDNTENIERWCAENRLPVLGKIPFDLSVTESITAGLPVVAYADNAVTMEIMKIWERAR
ncbi:ATP-binding protein [candidate division WOR-3 bacterium]|nr:ATP-binding protein [candidate division WOR-3 bacterium]